MNAGAVDPRTRHVSPWTRREKIGRCLWSLVETTVFRHSPRTAFRWRAWLLRCFGAKVDSLARIRRSVTIEIPWNLTIGPGAAIGDHVILYCLGSVTIGARATISQRAHLCAGTHDYSRPDMPLLRPPITLEDDVWIATEAFVGPGVTIGEGTVVGARACVVKDLPSWKVCVGNPAVPIKDREYLR